MAELALVLYLVYLGLAFGVRTLLHKKRTGSSGFMGISGRPGSAEWLGGVLFGVAIALGFTAPVIDLIGAVDPIAAVDGAAGHAVGLALTLIGLAGTLYAQGAMGTSWRIGVDEKDRTELVTSGPFAHVRNPIFAAMIPTSLGLVLLVPNLVAVIGFVALFLALELQTRVVEEPYLRRVHGAAYADYASRAGRFLPGVGRLPLN
jgi:protein-S-isoprenylcysteine O-methyltransferase Ste14